MNMLGKLLENWTRLLSTAGARGPFAAHKLLETRAAYLVQKSISEYSQARANMMFSSLLSEKSFQDAYEIARWKGFPAGLSMVAEVMFNTLRREHTNAASVLKGMAADIVSHYPVPANEEIDYWSNAITALENDLARAALGQGRAAHVIARARAKEIFDALPFHPVITQHDFDMFRNTLSFHLSGIAGEIEERGIAL